jgi:hypothetical protein
MAKKNFLKTPIAKFVVIIFIAALAIGGVVFLVTLSAEQLTPVTPVTPTEPTQYVINISDQMDSTNDEVMEDTVAVGWYYADISDLTDEEITDLTWSDFTLEIADDSTFTPDEDRIYIAKISGTDVETQYWATDSRIFEGLLPVFDGLGEYDVPCLNQSEDMSVLFYSNDAISTTLNQTDYREWSVILNCLDGSEGATANVTRMEGYQGFYDPSAAAYSSIIFEIQFNVTTASASYFTLLNPGVACEETVVGDTLFVEFYDSMFLGSSSLDFRFSTGLGNTFEVIGITTSLGTVASNTDLDSQN